MACRQATPQQLAYLDELKQRLQEMRKRQKVVMEETAEILRKINSDDSLTIVAASRVPSPEVLHRADNRHVTEPDTDPIPVGAEQISEQECAGKIKQLIQRFEDLRQTSSQFSDQTMPEELAAVDVKKLLTGYEKLIVDGDILQKSWLLLKKTTEKHASDCPRKGLARVSPKSRNEWTAQQVFSDLADCDKPSCGKTRNCFFHRYSESSTGGPDSKFVGFADREATRSPQILR